MTNDKTPSKEEAVTIKSLENSIEQLHAEVAFGSNAFKGNVEIAQNSIDEATKSFISGAEGLNKLFEGYESNSKALKGQIATLSLLPTKTKEVLKKLVPEISKEIENIHNQRMSDIDSTLKELQKSLNEEGRYQLDILKDLSENLQKLFNDNALEKHNLLEKIAKDNIEEIKKVQSNHMLEQEKMFRMVVHHTQKEVESVTANHGTKFFRNTAICLILSAAMAVFSSWCINKYMPHFVHLYPFGNVTIEHSNVRVIDDKKGN